MNIDNLNQHQVALLDKMWSIQTKGELNIWMATLDESDLNIVIVLRQLMIYEFIDTSTEDMKSEDFVEVSNLLSRLSN
jgi:hypothetical protein